MSVNKYVTIMDRKCSLDYISKITTNKNDRNIKVALNMIVKNEHDNIIRTLESVKEFCDLFIILDTGSEDDTKKIIIEYCNRINKPLHLISYPFENFSITRNIAIEYANDKADYLLFMDSNDELKDYEPKLKYFLQQNLHNERMLGLYIKQEWNSNGKLDRFFNIRLVRTKCEWQYKTPVHEYISCPRVEKYGTGACVIKIENGIYIYQDRSLDAHKSVKRHTRDKELLYKEYQRNPHDSRTLFYLAQTCSCLYQYEEAVKYYLLRTKEGGFQEEIFHAFLRSAEIASRFLKYSPEECIYLLTKALEISCTIFECPRSEPLIYLANMYMNNEKYLMAHIYIKQACESVTPECNLFVDGHLYDYTRWHMLGKTGYRVNDFNMGIIGCIMAYLSQKKDEDLDILKTHYIDEKVYNFDKLVEFLNTQTTQSMSKLFIIKKTDKNLQNHFLINNVQPILDKFKR